MEKVCFLTYLIFKKLIKNKKGTFTDKLYKRIEEIEAIHIKQVNILSHYVDNEDYDSDAIMQDIEDIAMNKEFKESNILKASKTHQLCEFLYEYIQEYKCMLYF